MGKRWPNLRQQPDLHDNGRVRQEKIALEATGRYVGNALGASSNIQPEAATPATATCSGHTILVYYFIPVISLEPDDPKLRRLEVRCLGTVFHRNVVNEKHSHSFVEGLNQRRTYYFSTLLLQMPFLPHSVFFPGLKTRIVASPKNESQ